MGFRHSLISSKTRIVGENQQKRPKKKHVDPRQFLRTSLRDGHDFVRSVS